MTDLTFAYLPGDGFITSRGHYFPEAQVRDALRTIIEWWNALPEETRAAIKEATGNR